MHSFAMPSARARLAESVYDELWSTEELRRLTRGVLRSVGLFAGSVVLMRLFGDQMNV